MSERTDAYKLACRLLDEPNADPDDALRVLARQLLRHKEWLEKLKQDLTAAQDPIGGLIAANRDATLRIYEEGMRRIKVALRPVDQPTFTEREKWLQRQIKRIVDAVNSFHPMHAESWKGWPDA